MKMTHRDFVIISEENVEFTHDEHERMAVQAIMNAVASRGKGKKGKIPTLKDLYDRNTQQSGSSDDNASTEDLFKQQQEAMEWLKNFNL